MRLAIVQTNPTFGEIGPNIKAAVALMEREKADLYVLPELFNTGYNFVDIGEVVRLAETIDGPTFKAVAAFARAAKCYVAYGFVEQDRAVYNSAILVGPAGMVGIYRKVHLYYRETLFFAPGNLGFPVFEMPFGKVGLMICFDWMYPESARTLALKGAQLIAHPSNLVMPYCPDAMITRCLENRIFAATADRTGEEHRGGIQLKYIGKSEIVSPRGQVLASLGNDEIGIKAVEIDLAEASNKKLNEYNDLIGSRRPDQYSLA